MPQASDMTVGCSSHGPYMHPFCFHRQKYLILVLLYTQVLTEYMGPRKPLGKTTKEQRKMRLQTKTLNGAKQRP